MLHGRLLRPFVERVEEEELGEESVRARAFSTGTRGNVRAERARREASTTPNACAVRKARS